LDAALVAGPLPRRVRGAARRGAVRRPEVGRPRAELLPRDADPARPGAQRRLLELARAASRLARAAALQRRAALLLPLQRIQDRRARRRLQTSKPLPPRRAPRPARAVRDLRRAT